MPGVSSLPVQTTPSYSLLAGCLSKTKSDASTTERWYYVFSSPARHAFGPFFFLFLRILTKPGETTLMLALNLQESNQQDRLAHLDLWYQLQELWGMCCFLKSYRVFPLTTAAHECRPHTVQTLFPNFSQFTPKISIRSIRVATFPKIRRMVPEVPVCMALTH